MIVLAIAAYIDPSIRILHAVEALPYLIAAALALRASKLGYALAAASGGLWFVIGTFRTAFVQSGFQQLQSYLRTGMAERPDLLLAVPASVSTAALVLFSLAAYSRLPHKRWEDLLLLAASALVVVLFFMSIFALFAPRYLGVFGIHVA